MKKINTNSYNICFGEDGYGYLKKIIEKNSYSKIFVIVDENTRKFCLDFFIKKSLIEPHLIEIEAGENFKKISTCEKVWLQLSKSSADRNSLIINLGGGVITDMGGFIASTFKRGINFINIPTTLLSMVDASLGSKTGINLDLLKNQIGLFSDPKLVIIDLEYLKTLNERQMKSGYAEIFKHSIISNSIYKNLIEDPSLLYNENIIYNSINVKNKIVSADKFESNIRKYLNFGHTIGHAVESLFLKRKNKLLHGEAIAIGMICESYISHKKTKFSLKKAIEIRDHLNSVFPKVNFNNNDLSTILQLIKHDKKNYLDKVKFVLIEEIGKMEIDIEVSERLIMNAFKFYLD